MASDCNLSATLANAYNSQGQFVGVEETVILPDQWYVVSNALSTSARQYLPFSTSDGTPHTAYCCESTLSRVRWVCEDGQAASAETCTVLVSEEAGSNCVPKTEGDCELKALRYMPNLG